MPPHKHVQRHEVLPSLPRDLRAKLKAGALCHATLPLEYHISTDLIKSKFIPNPVLENQMICHPAKICKNIQ